MAEILVQGRPVKHVQLECSLDQSISEACHDPSSTTAPTVVIEASSWKDAMSIGPDASSQAFSPGAKKSVTEVYLPIETILAVLYDCFVTEYELFLSSLL